MRKMPMIWAEGDKRDGKNDPCPCCGKELKAHSFFVYMIGGGGEVLHPEDAATNPQSDSEAWWTPVGPECRKKFGEFAVPESYLIALHAKNS